ncbi:NAD-dependent epimerase/dehydratase family protein [Phytohabitans sp. LJ34]|uniref:NAD-dependent epimerase/dehydratase family protein n=1 Tax=Phytohabitans sp. LJ34 TaxID=3452217 RepID=UPI003F8B6A87
MTGAAGFVGAHVTRALHADGHDVVASDLAPDPWRLTDLLDSPRLRYVTGDLARTLPEVMPGVQEVWHFAANADIPLGARDTSVDIRESILLTQRVLDSMRDHATPLIVFPSTSGVYGDNGAPVARESDGPLLPCSLYAAGKLACEGLISAYAHTFGLRGRIFRLGNVVGGGMGRGIIRDFVTKLSDNPDELHVLGDGRQRKSYVLVDDVVAGMRWIRDRPARDDLVDVVNLAAGGSLDVAGVAAAVAAAMELPAPRIVPTDAPLSWAGDQPVVELDIERALSTGWAPGHSAAEAVRIAAARILTSRGVKP